MKKITCLIAVAAITVCSISQTPSYTISARIEGAEGMTFTLQKQVNGKMTEINTAVVKNGAFVMKGGPVEYPDYTYLISGDRKSRLPFFLENSQITITGTLSKLNEAEISGSKSQDELKALIERMNPVISRYQEKNKELQSAGKSGDTALSDQLKKEIKSITGDLDMIQKEFVMSHSSSFVSPMVIQGIASQMSAAELEKTVNSLDRAVAETRIIKDLKARIEILKRVDIGQKAPDFTMNNQEGKPVTLSSLTGKNVLLVDFWAAWCGPCRQENPAVVKTFREFHEKGFDILGVSLDRTMDDWKKGIADDQLTWTHVSDLQFWNNSAAKLYGVNSIPANFLLSREGIIIAKNLRGEDLYNKVKELVAGK